MRILPRDRVRNADLVRNIFALEETKFGRFFMILERILLKSIKNSTLEIQNRALNTLNPDSGSENPKPQALKKSWNPNSPHQKQNVCLNNARHH